MEHTGKIREFIWKKHPFVIMIVYTISVKAFVSLHMVITVGNLYIKHINSCKCTSFKARNKGVFLY